jgi:hypothetical protein
MATRLITVSASGLAYTGDGYLKSVHLAAGGAAATAIVDDSEDGSGTDLLKLAAPTNGGDHWVTGDKDGVPFTTAVYVTLAGAGAVATVEIETA